MEQRVEDIEIENTNKKYSDEFEPRYYEQQMTALAERIHRMKEEALDNANSSATIANSQNYEAKYYEEIELIMHAVARLCNRQLRNYVKNLGS